MLETHLDVPRGGLGAVRRLGALGAGARQQSKKALDEFAEEHARIRAPPVESSSRQNHGHSRVQLRKRKVGSRSRLRRDLAQRPAGVLCHGGEQSDVPIKSQLHISYIRSAWSRSSRAPLERSTAMFCMLYLPLRPWSPRFLLLRTSSSSERASEYRRSPMYRRPSS